MTIPSEADEKLLEIIKPEVINAYLWYVNPFNVLKMIEVLRREEAERKEAAVAEAVRESKRSFAKQLADLLYEYEGTISGGKLQEILTTPQEAITTPKQDAHE